MKRTPPVVHRIPLTQARINLGQIVKRAHLNKECFVLEKDGIPIAGIMDVDDLEDWLELQDPKMQKQIAEGYREYRQGKARPARDFLAELKQGAASRQRKSSGMATPFLVVTPPAFEREARRLTRRNPEVAALLEEMIAVLEVDPYNRSHRHHITKLADIKPGQGQ